MSSNLGEVEELSAILIAYGGYCIESATLLPTDVSNRKMNMRQAKIAIQSLIAREVRKGRVEAERPFRELMLNKGSHPDYHDQQVEYLRVHWPLLYKELARIAELEGGEE